MYFVVEPYESDLQHHGIKGQRWGVRRYQNKDGTLTPLGYKKLGIDPNVPAQYDSNGRLSQASRDAIDPKVNKQVTSDYRGAKSVMDAARSVSDPAANILNRSASRAQANAKLRMNLSAISDNDLRSAINRMNLENQYKNLTTAQIGEGRRTLGDMLKTVGDVVAIGASVAGIMVAIHELKS